jgi:hypothetical protein
MRTRHRIQFHHEGNKRGAHFSLFPAVMAMGVPAASFSASLLLFLSGVSDIENTSRGGKEQQSGPKCDEAGFFNKLFGYPADSRSFVTKQ